MWDGIPRTSQSINQSVGNDGGTLADTYINTPLKSSTYIANRRKKRRKAPQCAARFIAPKYFPSISILCRINEYETTFNNNIFR